MTKIRHVETSRMIINHILWSGNISGIMLSNSQRHHMPCSYKCFKWTMGCLLLVFVTIWAVLLQDFTVNEIRNIFLYFRCVTSHKLIKSFRTWPLSWQRSCALIDGTPETLINETRPDYFHLWKPTEKHSTNTPPLLSASSGINHFHSNLGHGIRGYWTDNSSCRDEVKEQRKWRWKTNFKQEWCILG